MANMVKDDKLIQMVRIGIGVGMIGLGLQGSGYVQPTYKLEYSVKRCGGLTESQVYDSICVPRVLPAV